MGLNRLGFCHIRTPLSYLNLSVHKCAEVADHLLRAKQVFLHAVDTFFKPMDVLDLQ